MKKRFGVAMLSLTMALSLLVGCGGGSDSAGAAEEDAGAAQETAGAANEAAGGEETLLTITTSSTGGVFYYLGAAIQEVIPQKVDGVKFATEASGGSVENMRRLNSGEAQIGFGSPNSLKTEIEAGTCSAENFSLIGCCYPNIWQFVARGDNEATTISDGFVAGMRMGISEPGSSLQQQAEQSLAVVGLTLDDIKGDPIGQSEEIDALIDQRIDVGSFGGPAPFASVEQIAAQIDEGVHVLGWTEEQIAKLTEVDPFIIGNVIPAGTYNGHDYDALCPSWQIPVLISPSVDEDLVYEITKALYTSAEELGKIHPQGSTFVHENALARLEVYQEMGVDLHPGARRYYEEVGLLD